MNLILQLILLGAYLVNGFNSDSSNQIETETNGIDLEKVSEMIKIHEELNSTMTEYLKILSDKNKIMQLIESSSTSNSKVIINKR
jgi:hypothetical protein